MAVAAEVKVGGGDVAAAPARAGHLSERAVIGASTVVLALVAWEAVYRLRLVDPLFVSAPSRILAAAAELFAEGGIWNDLRVSGIEFLVGFFLAVVVGIPLGMVMGWYRPLAYALDPFVSALYATPRVALLPLVVIWLGIGIWSKIAIVFLGAVFPVLLSTYSGVRTTDARLLRAARSFGADDLQIFRTLILPGSVPFIVTGLRLGVGRALIGVVVGELYAAQAGIGFLISVAGNSFQTDKVFVGVFIIALVGIASMEFLTRLERRFEQWRPAVGSQI
jgi:NitT/TauT family transport system permease protein